MVERCAGLHGHRGDVVASTRAPGQGRRRFELQTQTFKSTLPGLVELVARLAGAGVTLVGMETTGVYWKTVFQALEDRFECWLLNAQHTCATSRDARPTPKIPSGSASSFSPGWSARVSCRRRRSAGCGT
jgi:hypothetical protein